MRKICWLSKKFGYLEGPTTVGLIRLNNNRVLLIDTGLNKDNAKKIDRCLKSEELKVDWIFTTHSHADHYGGNDYFLSRYQAKVLAPAGEAGIMKYPVWEPFYLFGGVPPVELKVEFLQPKPSRVDLPVTAGEFEIEGTQLSFIDLAGHSLFQLGIAFENYVFLADAFFSPEVWEKHYFVYFADVEKAEQTLKKLSELKNRGVVISHSGFYEKYQEIIDFNLEKIEETGKEVVELVAEGFYQTETILTELARRHKKQLDNLPSYFLARQTVISYLVRAKNKNLLDLRIKENSLHWKIKV